MKKVVLLFFFVSNISLAQTYLARVIEKNRFGYINPKGEYVIEPQFKEAKDFSSNGLAPAYDGKRWGFINTKGEWVIQPKYTFAKSFHSGYAIVKSEGEMMYIDIHEKTLEIPQTDKFYDFNDDDVAFIKKEEKVGLINTKGEILIKPKFTLIRAFNNKYARVKLIDKWGLIDTNGNIFVKPIYDEIGHYYNGIVNARKGKEFGLIIDGEFKIIEGATKILPFEGDGELAATRKKGKFGYINKEGEWVIEPTFKQAKPFYYGLARVYIKGLWGFINSKGEWVIKPYHDETRRFSDDGIALYKKDKHWGFMNRSGVRITAPIYNIGAAFDVVSLYADNEGYKNGLARVKYKGKWGFLDTKGQPIANRWWDNAEFFIEINNNEL